MTPIEALVMIDEILASVNLSRVQHSNVIRAVKTIEAELVKSTAEPAPSTDSE